DADPGEPLRSPGLLPWLSARSIALQRGDLDHLLVLDADAYGRRPHLVAGRRGFELVLAGVDGEGAPEGALPDVLVVPMDHEPWHLRGTDGEHRQARLQLGGLVVRVLGPLGVVVALADELGALVLAPRGRRLPGVAVAVGEVEQDADRLRLEPVRLGE